MSDQIVRRVGAWAAANEDIRAVALVGSHARGDARPDSDVDLVLLCRERERYLRSTEWIRAFGEPLRFSIEEWGKVRSVRVFYRGGAEIEFSLAAPRGHDGGAAIELPGFRVDRFLRRREGHTFARGSFRARRARR